MAQSSVPRGWEWFESIQGLRAAAMTLVFLHHAGVQLHPFTSAGWPSALAAIGPLGTDTFFLLAGAFTYRSLVREAIHPFEFIRRRAVRLYPLYLAVFGVYVLLELVFRQGRLPLPTDWGIASRYLSDLLLVSAIIGRQPLMDATWALQYIFAFYLISPIVVAPIQRLDTRWRPIVLAALWGIAAGVSLATGWYPLRVTLLMAGALTWKLRRYGLPDWLYWAAAAAGLALRFGDLSAGWRFLGTALAIPSITMLALTEGSLVARGLSLRLPVWLGYSSYSFYLCHGLPVIAVSQYVLGRTPERQLPLALAGMWAASIAVTLVFHRLVEVPFSLKGRRNPVALFGREGAKPPGGEVAGGRSGLEWGRIAPVRPDRVEL